ncbi:MAG TPA: 4-hydroxy-3-methylbut-2-enyl diphosphate reductase [Ktedonobacterales bacterium]|nr:4-hydroxy-3-methylbut-2-enyl diphosphate reductase [Ktedonobacterales bacterium]
MDRRDNVATAQHIDVIKVTPRGYCYGVVDAMQIARNAAKDNSLPRPIFVIGQIVHNRFAVEELTRLGIVTLDGPDRAAILEQVDQGTVIFTAHGVSPLVKQRARERGLRVIDATCPDVTKTHTLVAEYAARGYEIIYIGKKGHPEPEGVIGEAPEHAHLVENTTDVDALPPQVLDAPRLMVTNQTTLSQWDTADLIAYIRRRSPQVEVNNEICHATQERQMAVARMALGADLTIVVGDPRSNNTNRLAQVAEEKAGSPAIRIESLSDLTPEMLKGKRRVAITAGASTPSQLTREVIRFVESFGAKTRIIPAAPAEDAMTHDRVQTTDATDAAETGETIDPLL